MVQNVARNSFQGSWIAVEIQTDTGIYELCTWKQSNRISLLL